MTGHLYKNLAWFMERHTDLDEALQLVVLCQELSLLLLQGKDVLCRLLQNGCLQIQQMYKNIGPELVFFRVNKTNSTAHLVCVCGVLAPC